ncbi:MAG: hypothetical protein K2F57_05685, partial [Candidatus Gastranaerophilales bacterium]|nr:hypothetical protein [Candidatus Gastranaerophilales bacterium]
MSEYFVENNKFLGFKGVLGRRDFIVNCLIIDVLELVLWVTPLMIMSFVEPEFFSVLSGASRPLWLSVCLVFVGLISCGLYFPSIVRRVRDIIGEEDDNRIFLISTVITVILFAGYTPVGAMSWGRWIVLFVLFLLVLKKGKITGEKPKSEVIKFNWGAFAGTWFWGLANKAPVTLLMIPLLFTCGWFPFMLICGLKGNEWAYKNKEKYDTVEKLHDSQAKQSVVFLILTPLLFLITSMGASFIVGASVLKYSKSHPEFKSKVESKFKAYQAEAVEASFDKIELTENEYKFFVDPEDWVETSESLQKTLFKNAINYVLIKKDKKYLTVENALDSIDIINQIKIYSMFN